MGVTISNELARKWGLTGDRARDRPRRYVVLRSFCIGLGLDVRAGDVVELPEGQARGWQAMGKIAPASPDAPVVKLDQPPVKPERSGRFRVLRPFALGGRDLEVGEVITLPERQARQWVATARIEVYTAPAPPPPPPLGGDGDLDLDNGDPDLDDADPQLDAGGPGLDTRGARKARKARKA